MAVAAITFTYNETVNLPLWIQYYGSNFGNANLFVADRGSTDGSTDGLHDVNLIKVPRLEFDEYQKTDFITHLQNSLQNFYDAVIITDCDEFIVPDPDHFPSLRHYVDQMTDEMVNVVGLDLLHIINHEDPINLLEPILSQRHYARFSPPGCKPLVSRINLRWLPGFHSCDRAPNPDPRLFMFHLKFFDYNTAMTRQRINRDTVWSQRSLDAKFGEHHRFDSAKFVHEGFLVPLDLLNREQIADFEFSAELNQLVAETEIANSFHYIPMTKIRPKLVRVPDRFQTAF